VEAANVTVLPEAVEAPVLEILRSA
jgi:hypothetical protein